jgi:excisionase family DNA binding protein
MTATRTISPLAVGLEEASAMLAVAPRTLRKWATDRRVKSVKLGSRLVFRVSDLEQFLEERLRKEERPAENGPQKGFLTHAAPQ